MKIRLKLRGTKPKKQPAPPPEPEQPKVELPALPELDSRQLALATYVLIRLYVKNSTIVSSEKAYLSKVSTIFAEWRKRLGTNQLCAILEKTISDLSVRTTLDNLETSLGYLGLDEALKELGYKKKGKKHGSADCNKVAERSERRSSKKISLSLSSDAPKKRKTTLRWGSGNSRPSRRENS